MIKPPTIILFKPQLGRNIGSVMRCMANFCFYDLRLIQARDGWPNVDANPTSSGAKRFVNVNVFPSIEDACKDINLLIATTIRKRDLNIRELNIDDAISKSFVKGTSSVKTGFLFGCENSGLSNEEIVKSDFFLSIPVNRQFSSLNISHAVGIICWEFYKKRFSNVSELVNLHNQNFNEMAKISEKEYFFSKLNEMLNKTNFIKQNKSNDSIMQIIKSLFNKSSLTSKEIKILNGVIKSLFHYDNQA